MKTPPPENRIEAETDAATVTPRDEPGGLSPGEKQAETGAAGHAGPGAPALALPDESSLPPPDRPAWPLERIRELLASGKPACAFWALRRVATNAYPVEAADLAAAVDCLLDDPDLVCWSLDLFRNLAGHPAARDVAAAIAARPSPLDDDDGLEQRLSLRVLASLAPAEHVSSFAAGLESGFDEVEIAALDGIAASRNERP